MDEGPSSPAAAVVGSGPYTTGLYAAQAALARSDASRKLQYQWLLQGTPYAQFQLRTADGGALVLYGMDLDTVTQHPAPATGSPPAGLPIPVPAAAAALFPKPEIGYHGLWINYTNEYAAIDPPPNAHNATLQVIGADGGITYAHADL